MYYNNIGMEASKKLVELEIENRKYVLSLYPSVAEVLSHFDGKQITKRIETALQKIDKHLYIRREYNTFSVKYYCENRSIKGDNGNWHYLKNSEIHLFDATCFDAYEEDGILNTDNTLNFEKLNVIIEGDKNYIGKETTNMQKDLAEIEAYIEEYKELEKQCKDFNNKIDYTVKEYFNLKDFNNY